MNNKGFFLQLKYTHLGEITRKCYQIRRFYTHVITRRLHAFYARVGAAIPLTGTVMFNPLTPVPAVMGCDDPWSLFDQN